MRTKDNLLHAAKARVREDLIRSVLNQLFKPDQNYSKCLDNLIDTVITVGDRKYEFTKPRGTWTIEDLDAFGYKLGFDINRAEMIHHSDDKDDERDYVELTEVSSLTLWRDSTLTTSGLLASLVQFVTEITCSYHPDGRPLEFN